MIHPARPLKTATGRRAHVIKAAQPVDLNPSTPRFFDVKVWKKWMICYLQVAFGKLAGALVKALWGNASQVVQKCL